MAPETVIERLADVAEAALTGTAAPQPFAWVIGASLRVDDEAKGSRQGNGLSPWTSSMTDGSGVRTPCFQRVRPPF